VPLYRDPKSDMLVVQYSMKYAEEAGLVKFDFLGLRTLTILQRAVLLLGKRGIAVDVSKIPYDDAATYALLGRAETLGVFQFESAGMQDALRKLKPDCLEDLIALGALYRPGPMDNIPTYIARKHGRERPDYLHPMLEAVLKETYGVIIYQEQVQKIAQVMAGYTLGSADLLRRAMGKKIKSEMDAQRAAFVEGAQKNGVSDTQSSSIFDLVAKFAGYGFNKSHAAAYAVIAYQTAYLKANYPVEFLAASMTYEIASTDKLSEFRQEVKRCGITLLPPDINASDVYFSVEAQACGTLAVRYGLAALKNVGAAAMAALIKTREEGGKFTDIFDFAGRVDATVLNRRQLESLIMAGCFDRMHPNRRALVEAMDLILATAQRASADRHSSQISLFGGESAPEQRQNLPACEAWSSFDQLQHEAAALGFYLSAHPLEVYAPAFKRLGIVASTGLLGRLGTQYQPVKLAGIVSGSKIKTSPRGRFAFVQLSDAAGSYEVSIFDAELLSASHALLTEGTALLIQADGKRDENGLRLIARKLSRLSDVGIDLGAARLHITLHDIAVLPQLQALLKPAASKGAEVTLELPLTEGRVKIGLPGMYEVAPDALGSIRSLPALEAVAA